MAKFSSFLNNIFTKKGNSNKLQKFCRGEIVQIRSEEEIAASLDKNGTLEGLPFMPEMRIYCGKKFKVSKSVNKLIIEGTGLGMRRIKNAFILEDVICHGKAHEECNRTCALLWKKAWLKKAENDFEENRIAKKEAGLNNLNVKKDMASGIFNCQTTCLAKATSPLPKWDLRQYIWDITSGTFKPLERLGTILFSLFWRVMELTTVVKKPRIHGKLTKTPSIDLDIRPGDIVEVKSKAEILATLDFSAKNRGLVFTEEMLKYCNKKFRVLKKLNKMIDENTGKMQHISNTLILEGVTCDGKAHGGCQRNCLCFWREIWLRKV